MVEFRDLLAVTVLSGLLSACTTLADETESQDEQALAARQPCVHRLQAGDHLAVIGITDDDRVLYWDAGAVYATSLWPGARRELVTAASAPPMTIVVGRVALIWTDEPYFSAPAPSPLVVWTAVHGADGVGVVAATCGGPDPGAHRGESG